MSRLQAEMPVDRGLQLGFVGRIGHLTHLVSEDESYYATRACSRGGPVYLSVRAEQKA